MRKRGLISSVVLAMFLIFGCFSAYANTIYVPGDYPTIQEAIDAAINGDTILVAAGTYVENINFLGKAITLQSESGAGETIIDGNQSGVVVIFSNGETQDSVIDGFTIKNGAGDYSTGGGGIYCNGSSPTITNCIIKENYAPNAGAAGIRCISNSAPVIINCEISGHAEKGGVSGIFSSLTFINCLIRDNYSTSGGGIYLSMSDLTIIDSSIINNHATSSGGGISVESAASVTITNSIIEDNTAGGDGGGAYLSTSQLTMTSCRIERNQSNSGGGGIKFNGGGPTVPMSSISDCVISENSASSGGGLYLLHATLEIDSSEISANTSDSSGGGIYTTATFYGDLTISNSTISNNLVNWGGSSTGGGGIYFHHRNNLPAKVENCFIAENTVNDSYNGEGRGGGIFAYDSSPEITNCTIVRNEASEGGGIACYEDGEQTIPVITNCTISENNAFDVGGGMYVYYTYSPSIAITNSIFWNNSAPESPEIFQFASSLDVNFCDIKGDSVWSSGQGNINLDPFFFNPDNYDFGLSASSPCIDTGDPELKVPLNAGERIDMGAHEYDTSLLEFSNYPETVQVGEDITWNVSLENRRIFANSPAEVWIDYVSGDQTGQIYKGKAAKFPPPTPSHVPTPYTITVSFDTPGYYTIRGMIGLEGYKIIDSESFSVEVE